MTLKSVVLFLSVLTLFGCNKKQGTRITASENQPDQSSVAASGDLRCNIYLNTPDNMDKPLPAILYFAGTGRYSVGGKSSLPPPLNVALEDNKAVILTVDKPGISYQPQTREGFTVEESIFYKHTQKDLVECGKNALRWLRKQSESTYSGKVYFVGHSEGAQVLVRILSEATDQNLKLAEDVQFLMLSGLPMLSWKDILKHQLSESEWNKFLSAYKNKNDKLLIDMMQMGYAYWVDIFNTEPLESTLKNLQERKTRNAFLIFQGINDDNTIVKPIWDFEAANLEKIKARENSLRIQARYYLAPHNLNMAAMNDMAYTLLVNL